MCDDMTAQVMQVGEAAPPMPVILNAVKNLKTDVCCRRVGLQKTSVRFFDFDLQKNIENRRERS